MGRKGYLVVILILVLSMAVLNVVFASNSTRDSSEISAEQYAHLEALMDHYPAVAAAARKCAGPDKVTVSEYNEIMSRVRLLGDRRARRGMRQPAAEPEE